MARNRKIHDWTKQLVIQANRVGIWATDPVFNRSRKGYYSAYFGVPGLGEVRVSDHPMQRSKSTADISISSPATYLDLVRAFIFAHNRVLGTNFTVVDQPPYVIDREEGADIIRAIEEIRSRNEEARSALDAEVSARAAWWAERIAGSGLEGSPKDIKQQLKRQGVRYPGDGAKENVNGTR